MHTCDLCSLNRRATRHTLPRKRSTPLHVQSIIKINSLYYQKWHEASRTNKTRRRSVKLCACATFCILCNISKWHKRRVQHIWKHCARTRRETHANIVCTDGASLSEFIVQKISHPIYYVWMRCASLQLGGKHSA